MRVRIKSLVAHIGNSPRNLSAFDTYRTDFSSGGSNASFGRVLGGAFGLLGLWPFIHHQSPRWWALTMAIVLLAISVIAPDSLQGLNRAWAWVGHLLHRIVSPLIMSLIFFLVITPTAAVRRFRVTDCLGQRPGRDKSSYWILRTPPGPDPRSVENQF
jgi:Saxitoxin biosynthesis operon protein SxtJ